MSKVTVNEDSLLYTAMAIRQKLDVETLFKPSEFAAAITQIESYPEPTGTVNITSNGTKNVKNYATADVNVPNSYSASDEGKVVEEGELVAQTSKSITENGTYDTTKNNSVTVNVSGGGGGGASEIDIDALIPTLSASTGAESASSSVNANFAPWRAFDGINTQSSMQGGWLAGAGDYSPWIKYEWGTLEKVDLITINTANNGATRTVNVKIEGLNSNDEWVNCLAQGENVPLTFLSGTYGNLTPRHAIQLNGNSYKGFKITGLDRFYYGANQSACTFDQIQVYQVNATLPALGYYGLGTPSSSLGSNGNMYCDFGTKTVYRKVSGAWQVL